MQTTFKTITYYQYINNLYSNVSNIDNIILQQRFVNENAQAVNTDDSFTIISKRIETN